VESTSCQVLSKFGWSFSIKEDSFTIKVEMVYSGTSLKGLSKLRTQYKKLPIEDKFCSPNGTTLIHFTSERETSI